MAATGEGARLGVQEYVIARIRRNIEYRRRKAEESTEGAVGGAKSGEGTERGNEKDGFEAFSTQQIQEAWEKRKKRKRQSSWVESSSKKTASDGASQDQERVRGRENTAAFTPSPRTRPKSPARRSDSFLGLGLRYDHAPPSGGAASRANTSFARTTSFVTATEGDDESRSISSSNLPPPISPTGHGEASDDEHFIQGLETQDWRDFLESTQGRALDGMETSTTPRTHRPTPKPEYQNQLPRPSARKAKQHAKSGELHLDQPIRWNLKLENVPAGATKLWCVRKGLVPGFHFQEPLLPPLSQSRAFREIHFETFDTRLDNLCDVIKRANRYMDHSPGECRADYVMCHSDCRRLVQDKCSNAKSDAGVGGKLT